GSVLGSSLSVEDIAVTLIATRLASNVDEWPGVPVSSPERTTEPNLTGRFSFLLGVGKTQQESQGVPIAEAGAPPILRVMGERSAVAASYPHAVAPLVTVGDETLLGG